MILPFRLYSFKRVYDYHSFYSKSLFKSQNKSSRRRKHVKIICIKREYCSQGSSVHFFTSTLEKYFDIRISRPRKKKEMKDRKKVKYKFKTASVSEPTQVSFFWRPKTLISNGLIFMRQPFSSNAKFGPNEAKLFFFTFFTKLVLACRTTNILLVCTFFVGLDFTTQAKINTFLLLSSTFNLRILLLP